MSSERAAEPLILRGARESGTRLFIQFGGQGAPFLGEMRKLYKDRPELAHFFKQCFQAIDEILAWDDFKDSPWLAHGFALKRWLENEDVPPQDYLFTCTISLPCTEITQLAYYHVLLQNGYDSTELMKHSTALTGHSQGVLAATLTAMDLRGDEFDLALRRYIQHMLLCGLHCQDYFPIRELPADVVNKSMELDDEPPTPMVSIAGVGMDELQEMLNGINGELAPDHEITISLINTPDSLVLSGYQEDLVALRQRVIKRFTEMDYKWKYLEISSPFHSHIMLPVLPILNADLKRIGFTYTGADLKFPVINTLDGKNLQDSEANLGELIFEHASSRRMDWPGCVRPLLEDEGITHVLDCGPGRVAKNFTRALLDAKNPDREVEILALARKNEMGAALQTENQT